jgi:uncharacterized protein with gpF-like domain
MPPVFESLPFAEAIEFLKRKTNIGTAHWDDLWRGMHSRAFMVAGAMQDDLVAGFHDAIDRAIAEGTTLEEFRQDFDALVKRFGWSYHGTRGWRSALIFDTNLQVAYSAGRYRQQTDPDVLADRPYLMYLHGDSVDPRPEHLAWNGLVLPADDPWWDTHYPPNGWGCTCTAVSVSRRDLERMKKTGPDKAPNDGTYAWKDMRGTRHLIPVGIDPGWDYNPGQAAYDKITVKTRR